MQTAKKGIKNPEIAALCLKSFAGGFQQFSASGASEAENCDPENRRERVQGTPIIKI